MIPTQLRFFGPGLIADQHGQPIPMRSRKQLALLAYLATEQQSAHSRETLLALFPRHELPSCVARVSCCMFSD